MKQKPNSITYYRKDGSIIATLPLAGGSDHFYRSSLAHIHNIKFEYYSLHDRQECMDKNGTRWFNINLKTGIEIEGTSVPVGHIKKK